MSGPVLDTAIRSDYHSIIENNRGNFGPRSVEELINTDIIASGERIKLHKRARLCATISGIILIAATALTILGIALSLTGSSILGATLLGLVSVGTLLTGVIIVSAIIGFTILIVSAVNKHKYTQSLEQLNSCYIRNRREERKEEKKNPSFFQARPPAKRSSDVNAPLFTA